MQSKMLDLLLVLHIEPGKVMRIDLGGIIFQCFLLVVQGFSNKEMVIFDLGENLHHGYYAARTISRGG